MGNKWKAIDDYIEDEGRERECAHDYYQINYLIITEIKVCQLPQQMIKLRVNFL